MSDCQLIMDPGSIYNEDNRYAQEFIALAKEAGVWLKPQLLPASEAEGTPNLPFDFESAPWMFELAREEGVTLVGSVWNEEGLRTLRACGVENIKFSFSQRKNLDLIHEACNEPAFKRVFVSGDLFDTPWVENPKIIRLYCPSVGGVPLYPQPFLVDMDGLFDTFDGLSDHSLGWSQTRQAMHRGARYVEFHARLEHKSATADALFARSPQSVLDFCRETDEPVEWPPDYLPLWRPRA